MIFFSIGLPGRLADWCDALLVRLAEYRYGSGQAIALNGLEELAAAVIRAQTPGLVACCRQPTLPLQTELLQAQRPLLVALADPRSAVRHLIEESGYPLADATRAVASSCAALLTLRKSPHTLVIMPEHLREPVAIATAAVEHFEIPIARQDFPRLLEQLPDGGPGSEWTDDSWWENLPERDKATVNGAVQSYVAHFAGDNFGRLVWEPELFFASDEPQPPTPVPATRPVDITGRSRFLVYGPYIRLPPGPWSAEVVLGFSADAAGMSFFIEVVTGTQLAHARVTVAGEEVVETRLNFTIGNENDQPVQIRVLNERAAFDGRLAMGHVAIVPQASISDEIRQRLANLLRL
jgi:hypothetical protein